MFSEFIFSIKDIWYHLILRLCLRDCSSVLDVGCGASSPLAYAKENKVTEGIDGYAASIAQSKKNRIHGSYKTGDIRRLGHLYAPKSYDAVIALDVVEHLTRKEGFQLISDMEAIARKKVVVMTPNGFYKQEDIDGNKLQVHQSGWSVMDFERLHFKAFGIRGLKWLRHEHATLRLKPWIFWGFISFVSEPLLTLFPQWSYQIFAVHDIDQKKETFDVKKFVWSATHSVYERLGPANAWKLAMSPLVVVILKFIAYIAGSRTIAFTTKYGLTLKLRVGDILFGGFLHLGESNPMEMYVLRKILNPNDVVFDVGANLGWYALNSAQVVGSSGQVYAFEPNPAVANWASENCCLNHLTNVKIEKIALADKTSTLEFYIGDNFGSLVKKVARLDSRKIKRISVPVTTVDDYIKGLSIKKVSLIKIDAEGKDFEVLRGAVQTLKQYHPYLIVEVFGLSWDTDVGRDKEILAYLEKLGYQAYAFVQGGLQHYNPRNGQPQIINLFFARSETELRKLLLVK